MITDADIKSYFRDLVYLEEKALELLDEINLSDEARKKVYDNLVEKQIIVTKILALFEHDAPHGPIK